MEHDMHYKWTPVRELQPGDKLDLFRDKIANRRMQDDPYRWEFPRVEAVNVVEEQCEWWGSGDLLEVVFDDHSVRFPKHHEVKVVV